MVVEAEDEVTVRRWAGAGAIYYRLNDDNNGPELFMEVCVERGWRAWEGPAEADGWGSSWHLWWRHGFPPGVYRRLRPHQVINHIPRANGLCKKDSLARALQKMKHVFGSIFDFMPATYLLPCEYTKLVAEYTRVMYNKNQHQWTPGATGERGQGQGQGQGWGHQQQQQQPPNIWICKPTASSQGRGISIFQELHELSYTCSAVVQRYVHNPLLVGGYKCDVRLYVLVTSFLPLTVYIYHEGIVRFGTEKYSLAALDNVFSHLTNTSLNKLAPGYRTEKDRVGAGCKWTVGELRRYLCGSVSGRGVPRDWLLWHQVWILVNLSLVTQLGLVHHHHNCFELYGFDILVDEGLTPWLLEVNRCPSLSYDCDVDRLVKKPLLHHLFDLVGPPRVCDPLGRSLRPPPLLLLLARATHQGRTTTTHPDGDLTLGQYDRLMESLQRVATPPGGGQCRRRAVGGGGGGGRRQEDRASLDALLPPPTTNTTLQRMRRQLVNSRTSRGYTSLAKVGGGGGQVGRGPEGRWPARCGGWVRTFPYNAATLHASRDQVHTKRLVADLHKVRRLALRLYTTHRDTAQHLDSLLQKHMWRDTVIWRPKT